ncbi:MAG TPA: HEAT repeat domain-containing protein [Nitrospirae bacterium]|nr:HEAT repeat domain-containing protein [Nitrospirota bacterium]
MSPFKKKIIGLLEKREYGKLAGLSPNASKLFSALISLSYDKKNTLAWRAIEAIGVITARISLSDPATVRNLAGRLLWTIRDESGGIGWSAPEILGEIVLNNPDLCADIAPVIVSFHEEAPLRTGVLRAIGRMGRSNAEMAAYAIPVALPLLSSPDPVTRGCAAWALGQLGASEAASEFEKLVNDTDTFTFYEDGELKEKTVGGIAGEALEPL